MAALAVGVVLAAAPQSEGAPAPAWHYTATKDALRGTIDREACTSAVKAVRLSAPYRSQRPELCIRSYPGASKVYIDLPSGGQFTTHDWTHLKIDDGPIMVFHNATSDTNDTLFLTFEDVDPPADVLASEDFQAGNKWRQARPTLTQQIHAGHRMIVEVELYGDGTQEVTFNVSGLKWDAR